MQDAPAVYINSVEKAIYLSTKMSKSCIGFDDAATRDLISTLLLICTQSSGMLACSYLPKRLMLDLTCATFIPDIPESKPPSYIFSQLHQIHMYMHTFIVILHLLVRQTREK